MDDLIEFVYKARENQTYDLVEKTWSSIDSPGQNAG